jgi:putative FmdB family regulatory protein
MPTYEYACTSCSHEWEAEQSIKEPALTDCPQCTRSTARRQISRGTGFILKGSGWYSDLYSSAPSKKPDGGGDSGGGGDKGSSSTGGDGGSSSSGGSSSGGAPSGGAPSSTPASSSSKAAAA